MTGYDDLRWRDVYRALRLRTGSFYDPAAITAARERLADPLSAGRLSARHGRQRRERTRGRGRGAVHHRRRHADHGGGGGRHRRHRAAGRRAPGGVAHTGRQAAPPRGRARGRAPPAARSCARPGTTTPRSTASGCRAATMPACCGSPSQAGRRTEIEFVGNESRSREQLLGLMDLNARLIVTDGTWRELARRMRRYYQEGGYYRVKVRVKFVEGEPRRIVFTIDQGGLYTVRRLRFVGNTQVAARAAARRDEHPPGALAAVAAVGRVRARGVRRGPAPAVVLLPRARVRRRRDRRRAGRSRRRRRRHRPDGGDRRGAADDRGERPAARSDRAAAAQAAPDAAPGAGQAAAAGRAGRRHRDRSAARCAATATPTPRSSRW